MGAFDFTKDHLCKKHLFNYFLNVGAQLLACRHSEIVLEWKVWQERALCCCRPKLAAWEHKHTGANISTRIAQVPAETEVQEFPPQTVECHGIHAARRMRLWDPGQVQVLSQDIPAQ